MEAIFTSTESAIDNVERRLLDQIQSASSADDIRSFDLELDDIADSLAVAIFNLHLLGRAQIAVDVQRDQPTSAAYAALVLEGAFAPLPFEEAITFFGQKVTLPPFVFGALSDAAKAKAFSIAAGATDQILSNIREILDRALVDGVTLGEFQEQAADVLNRAGVGARQPWYWETVYRTNLQQSYQVGRWKQVNDPAVRAARPYLRYVSALLPTSRQSHVEKHGLIYPVGHAFWDTFMPPNGFNCAPAGSLVDTATGSIPIEKVTHGDYILTHLGRWQQVTELHRNPFFGQLVRLTMQDGRVLRLTPNHKVFTRRGWIEAACLNASDEVGDHTTTLRAFHSSPAPGSPQVGGCQVVQRDALCFDGPVPSQDHTIFPISVAFNADPIIRQKEIDPVRRKGRIEHIRYMGRLQHVSKDGFPFRHLSLSVGMGGWIPLVLRLFCGRHFRANLWATSRRDLLQFLRCAGNAWMVRLSSSLRPMRSGLIECFHSALHCLGLSFTPVRVPYPLQSNGFRTRSPWYPKPIEQLWYGSLGVNAQDATNFTGSFPLLTVQSPQKSGRVFLRGGRNTIDDNMKRITHSNSIIQRQCEFVDIAEIEYESFSGTVYNLGVAGDHSYCIEGLALHNCFCSVQSVSESLLEREGWEVSTEEPSTLLEADPGFQINAGQTEEI